MVQTNAQKNNKISESGVHLTFTAILLIFYTIASTVQPAGETNGKGQKIL